MILLTVPVFYPLLYELDFGVACLADLVRLALMIAFPALSLWLVGMGQG